MESDEELLENEEEILVYVEFEGLVDSNVFSEKQLQLDMIGIDTEHPIMQINGKFYEGTYEDAVGTYMFFDNDDNPVVDDPVFDVAPTLKYLCKTRKFLRMQRIFVESRTEVLGDSEHDRCVPNLDTIKQAGIPFRYQDEALSFWKTMRNDRRNALHSYLEKQRVRQELKSQGVKLESESDEDNPFAVYKHKEEAADLHKPEEPSVVSEKEQLTSLDNRMSGISENATHSEQVDDECFDNAETTNAGEKLDEDAASSESKASTCKSNERRLTAPVKGYKTKVSPRNKPLASHVKQTIKAKAKGTPAKSTKPLSQHASEKGSSDSEIKSDKEDERNVAESSSDRCEYRKYGCGELIVEGKTKEVYELPNDPTLCLLQSKDRITAGDGVKSHELKGKAAISTATTAKVFELLNKAGLKTAFVKVVSDTAFIAKKCHMVPIEWVTRRLATGSFLKRHPGVAEGYRFNPPLQETFFKDDANHDPQWSEQQIISAKFTLNGLLIAKDEYDVMQRTALSVFEVLERAWTTRDCALIDMKIEFGVDLNGEIMVADIIDSDSWRLWPSGDKRLMKDKQVYRNLATVTQEDLDTVKRNFEWVANQLDYLVPPARSLVVILMGSPSDEQHCKKIAMHATSLGLQVKVRVCSAHKGTQETLRILAEYEGNHDKVVLIAVAGRSNGLGPVLSGNTALPVINCPPFKPENVSQDLWSSINVPSGIGCTTVAYPETAALAAAQIHALHDHLVWARLRVKQLTNFIALKQADKKLRNLRV